MSYVFFKATFLGRPNSYRGAQIVEQLAMVLILTTGVR
jgi:hypothetical protein